MTNSEASSSEALAELRRRYRLERERRVRPDGTRQYLAADAEFGYYADDPYAAEAGQREPLRDRVDVAVVGGGFGGILAGARLRQQGIGRVRVLEKGGDFGGTWYWNRYPGIHCDIESHVYLPMLDETGYVPEWKYAPGEEIRRHAVRIAEKFDLCADALFSTSVTSLTWDETSQAWIVTTDRGDKFLATYVVTATGTLSELKLPGIPGIENFKGHTFHTSRWDYAYTGGTPDGGLTGLAGKRVGVVGTGATGIQVIPKLAEDAGHLYVFQRTPSTVDVRANRRTTAQDVGADHDGWARERRDNFLRIVSGESVEEDLVADQWTSSAGLLEKLLPSFRRPADRQAFEAAHEEAFDHVWTLDTALPGPDVGALLRLTRSEPGLRAVWLQTHDEAEPAFASDLAERAGLPADDVRPAIWAAMLNAALRAAVEHHAYRTTEPSTDPAAARADLAATLRTALAVTAAGLT